MKALSKRMQQGRRDFLVSAAMTCGTLVLSPLQRKAIGASKVDSSAKVAIISYGSDGKKIGRTDVPKIVKSEEEWKQQLSPSAFEVARHAGTERAYTGESWDEHGKGLYRCVCCDTAVFSSETKFDSHTGWPSFWQAIARENVVEKTDASVGRRRTAVACRLCEGHLGHVFDDGPRPTGLRYCMNSAAMRFVKLT